MRILIVVLALILFTNTSAQTLSGGQASEPSKGEKYVSFNPFGLLESAMAVGAGFGNRFSEKSEYFTELSYLARSPLFPGYINSLHGFRFISQYRFHFLPRGSSLSTSFSRTGRTETEFFAAFEFRLRQYDFSDSASFTKSSPRDTIALFGYNADATIFGAAVLLGLSQSLSANGRLKIEGTLGFGLKWKDVAFHNLPLGYEVAKLRRVEWGFVPSIYESTNSFYIPATLRLRYMLR